MLTIQIVATLIALAHAISNRICSFPSLEPDQVELFHDPYHSIVTLEWKVVNQLHTLMRTKLGGQQPLPGCDDVESILYQSPAPLDWSRDEAVAHIGDAPANSGTCPQFPLQLYQNQTTVTVDCFFLNQGDSRITWISDDAVCVGKLSPAKIDRLCTSLGTFMRRIVESAGTRNAQRYARNQAVIQNAITQLRPHMAESDSEDEEEDWD